MEGMTDDPKVRRALAIVLLREVLPLLGSLDEEDAARHVNMAIGMVLRAGMDSAPRAGG